MADQPQRPQQQVEKIQRAQERIERDPEEALHAIEARTKATDGSPITVQDMFSLFGQLNKTVNMLMERQQEQQDAIVQVLLGQQQREKRNERETAAELEQAALQRKLTLEAWDTEPREPIFVEPTVDEKNAHAVMNEWPRRVYRVNGLEYPIPVGEVVTVPGSIAALVRHSQKQKEHRIYRPAQDPDSIPRPQQARFLASATEVTAGQAGVTGEGRLIPAAVPYSPDQAQPLDIRYDAFGR